MNSKFLSKERCWYSDKTPWLPNKHKYKNQSKKIRKVQKLNCCGISHCAGCRSSILCGSDRQSEDSSIHYNTLYHSLLYNSLLYYTLHCTIPYTAMPYTVPYTTLLHLASYTEPNTTLLYLPTCCTTPHWHEVTYCAKLCSAFCFDSIHSDWYTLFYYTVQNSSLISVQNDCALLWLDPRWLICTVCIILQCKTVHWAKQLLWLDPRWLTRLPSVMTAPLLLLPIDFYFSHCIFLFLLLFFSNRQNRKYTITEKRKCTKHRQIRNTEIQKNLKYTNTEYSLAVSHLRTHLKCPAAV